MAMNESTLNFLSSLPSKAEVAALFDACFRHRHDLTMVRTDALLSAGLGQSEAEEVRCTLRARRDRTALLRRFPSR